MRNKSQTVEVSACGIELVATFFTICGDRLERVVPLLDILTVGKRRECLYAGT